MIVSLAIGCLLFFFVYDWLRPDNSLDRSKPGKFYLTKYYVFRILLWLKEWQQKKKKRRSSNKAISTETGSHHQRGYGSTVTDPILLENCVPLENDPFAIDTTYFNGFSQDGISVALRIARKQNREKEVWVLLDIPGVGFFQHPMHPDTGVFNTDTAGFSAAGCKFEMLEPMVRWRVTYNGLLRRGLCNKTDDKPQDYVYVKLSFKWNCINDPFNFDTDCDKGLLADAIAREKWTSEFWTKLRGKHQTHYEQVGELSGTIDIKGHSTQNVHLIGMRDHTFGFRNWEMFERYAIHYMWIPETGQMAMVCVLWMPNYITFLQTGFITYANGETIPVEAVNLDIVGLTVNDFPPEEYSFSFKAGKQTFQVQLRTTVTPVLYHYTSRSSKILERFCEYTINSKPARGMVEFHYRNPDRPPMLSTPPTSVPQLTEPASSELISSEREITLPFTERACCSSELVGGKGSQLALLTSIQNQVGCIVPKGFCVTLHAFERQIEEQASIAHSIQCIEDSLRNKSNVEQIKRVCSETVESLAGCKIIGPIERSVINQLQSLYSDKCEVVSLAVRSSAAGEDGDEVSSAGQMETFLGVCGIDKILEAITKCWASAYTYQAVKYRRQHGQPIGTAVGVVIQEMVQSDVSGVLFTNDPVTGNVNRMNIDASFGLGEVVVSGKTTPDRYSIQRLHDNQLTILERHLGEKNLLITVSDSGGTIETETVSADARRLCLSDTQVLNLCEIAISVEEYYGTSRDIEWAIQDDTVYLLQARPITTRDQDTDDDFLHEFDSALVTGNERVTLGNIGEMMPGCVTPLTGSLFARAVDIGTCRFLTLFAGGQLMKFASKVMYQTCGRLFLNMTLIAQIASNSLVSRKEALETNLLGEILYDHTIDMIKQYGVQNKSFISRLVTLLKFFYVSNQRVKVANSWDAKLKMYQVGSQYTTAIDLYNAIQNQIADYFEVWETTIMKSSVSGNMSSLVMGIISGGNNVWTVDNYSDVAMLLAHCQDVYSAEVPTSLQEMAKCINKLEVEQEFLQKTDQECVGYLTSSDCPKSLREMYAKFMERHGHRCVRESSMLSYGQLLFDLELTFQPQFLHIMQRTMGGSQKAEFIEKSWQSEPGKLIKVLKAIIRSKAYDGTSRTNTSLDESIRRLKSPVSTLGKFLLRKWIVPKTWHAVGQREFGKSISIKMADKFKQAFWRLSELLVHEGRLPDGELMFFMTNSEIGHLLKTRSSRLITRAVRRRRVFPLQSKLEFPRLTIGRPMPKQKPEESETRETTFTLSGMPVSQGSVKGTVRVVKSLEDASAIQTGDILVVNYTDVGWSPYFPLISGLVTEMGGLVSHGAVVAREYGLPCVVNVPMATDLLKTGDVVHLEGSIGKVNKLQDVTSS